MNSHDEDSQQRMALMLVFTLVAIIVASVVAFGARRAMHSGPRAMGPVVATGSAAARLPAFVAPAANAQSAAQAASDAASVKVEQGVVKFYFASAKADLAAGANAALTDVVKSAKEGRKLVIAGFHDPSGDASSNTALARQRAIAVQNALLAAGVNESQIALKKPEQLGETTFSSEAEKRRVEITVQ